MSQMLTHVSLFMRVLRHGHNLFNKNFYSMHKTKKISQLYRVATLYKEFCKYVTPHRISLHLREVVSY